MNNEKLQYLEALRGIAALMVVFAHLQYAFVRPLHYESYVWLKEQTGSFLLSHTIHSLFSLSFNGGLAVYIFWFMSAYVISIKLFYKNGKEYLFKSLIKRYFRLLIPVLGSVLLAFTLLELDLMYNKQLAQILGQGYENDWLDEYYSFDSSLVWAIRSSFWDTFFAFNQETSYNPVLWRTMDIELQGSFFIFALFALFELRKSRYIFYVIISLVLFILQKYAMVSFIFGFWLCDIDNNKNTLLKKAIDRLFRNDIINILLFLVVLLIAGKIDYFLSFGQLLASIAIVVFVMKAQVLQRMLNHKFFTWLGQVSFSLYLVHFPIICSFSCFLYLQINLSHQITIIIVSLSTLLLSFIVAHLFHHYIDKNSVRLANRIAYYFIKKELK